MRTLRVYILTRLLLTIPMLLVLVTLVFVVVRVMPGDPVEAMLRPGVPEEYKDQIRHSLGLDRPLFLNFSGSTARTLADALFLNAEPGTEGSKALRVEANQVLAVSKRASVKVNNGEHVEHWLQVAVPKEYVGWVSPDQMVRMRQVNIDMKVIEEGMIEETQTWTRLQAPDSPQGYQVNALWVEDSGLLWVGTENGVSRRSSAGWTSFEETIGVSIQAIWSGQPADVWFGTNKAGVLHFKNNQWTAITAADGLAGDRVFAIWGQSPTLVWFGTDKGASRQDGTTWTTFTKADGLAGQQVRAIWGDGRRTFWFGTEGGLSRFDGQEWLTFTTDDGLPSNEVKSLWGDGQGTLWVGTDQGLSRFDGSSWITFTAADGLAGDRINAMWGDDSLDLWAGTDAGVSVYDGQRWSGHAAIDELSHVEVRAIRSDSSGILWVGTTDGLGQLDTRPWSKVQVPEGGMEGWARVDEFHITINPFDSQYLRYMWNLIHLDLGESLAPTRGRPVIEDLKQKFPATFELAVAALVVTMVVGVSTGAYAAHKRRSAVDYGLRFFSIIIWAVPVFWLGMMFQLILGVYFGQWYETSTIGKQVLQPIFGGFLPLPISGRIGMDLTPQPITGLLTVDSVLSGNWKAFGSAVRYLILPALTLGLYLSGVFTRLTRSNMLDVLQEDYVTAARARGIKERAVVYKHALKNAFVPILTMMGLQFAVLLAGAVLTETTFSWPGMGLFMVERIGYRDFNSIQGSVVVFAILVAAVSLIVDVIYAWIDPRIRY